MGDTGRDGGMEGAYDIKKKDARKRYRRMLYYSMLWMNLIAWCGVCLFISSAYQGILIPDLICVMGIFLYYILIHLLRTWAKRLWMLVAGHIVLYLPMVYYVVRTQDMFEEMAAFYFVMLTCCFISSVLMYRQGGQAYYYGKWYHAAEVVVMYLWGVFRHEMRFTMMGLFLGIVLLLFHFWCTYLSRFNDYMQEKREITDFSVENIFQLNTKCITHFLVLAGLLMLAAVMGRYDAWLEPLKHYLLLVLRYVIWVVQLFLAWLRSLNHPESPGRTGESDIGELQTPETGFLTDNIILAIIGTLAVTTLFVLGLREFYLKLRDMLKKQHEGILQETIFIDQIEELPPEETLLKRLARRIFRDNREKVRYHFKHRVQRALKNSIRDSETAGRLHERVNASGRDQIDALTALYQVARYSEQEITPAEIKLAGKK